MVTIETLSLLDYESLLVVALLNIASAIKNKKLIFTM